MTLILIAAASLGAWVYLTLFRGFFWRASERLEKAVPSHNLPEVVAVIPARNEVESIGAVIRAHMACDYPSRFSVILVDDHSTDGTAEAAQQAAAQDPARELQIVSSAELPNNWSGKLWAIHQGLVQAEETFAKYILLTDADIVLAPDTLKRLVSKAEDQNIALASLMARLDAEGKWGALFIPAFIYFFQKLYPFPLANDVSEDCAAAAGGVMLVRKNALERIGGVEEIKSELIDDCALAQRVKDISPTTKIWLGLADDEAVSLRDNHRFSSIWNMIARTAFTQLKYSSLLLIGTVAAMAIIYMAPPVLALTIGWHENLSAFVLALAAWALMIITYVPTLDLYKRPRWEALLLPIAGAFCTAMTISSALRFWRGKGGQWKGRTY